MSVKCLCREKHLSVSRIQIFGVTQPSSADSVLPGGVKWGTTNRLGTRKQKIAFEQLTPWRSGRLRAFIIHETFLQNPTSTLLALSLLNTALFVVEMG